MKSDGRSGRQISPENWTAFFIAVDFVSIALSAGTLLSVVNILKIKTNPIWSGESVAVLILAAIYVAIGRATGLYCERSIFEIGHFVRRVWVCAALTSLSVLAATTLTQNETQYPFFWPLLAGGCGAIAAAVLRLFLLFHVNSGLKSKDLYVFRALALGVCCEAPALEEIEQSTSNRVRPVRRLRLDDIEGLSSVSAIVASDKIDRIYLTSSWRHSSEALMKLGLMQNYSCETSIVADMCQTSDSAVNSVQQRPDDSISIAVIDLHFDRWKVCFKRAQDILIATAILTVASPLMLLLAIAIKMESSGPILSRRMRAGLENSACELWTFRSSFHVEFGPHEQLTRHPALPTLTRVGRFLSRTSLDRLPLFLNVLQGRLSIVGPRPSSLEKSVVGHNLEDLSVRYATSNRIKAGLTGLAQVEGFRGELDSIMEMRSRLVADLIYVQQRSAWLDIKIILRTVLIVVRDCARGERATV